MVETMLASLLGEIAGDDHVYALRLPENFTYPVVVFQPVSGGKPVAHDGPTGLAWVRIQVDTYAETYEGCKDIAEQIKEDLNGYQGPVGDGTIDGIFIDGEWDLFEESKKLYRAVVDFRIYYH